MDAETKKKGLPMLLDIAVLDGTGLQSRAALDEETVEEYAEVYRAHAGSSSAMPPVRVVYNDATAHHWLADGFHRVAAAKRAGMTKISALVTSGTHADALREAIGANVTNGLRRTNEDKRHALEMAWENRLELFGGDPSNGVLADACGVSERTVIRFRQELRRDNVTPQADEIPEVPTARIGRDGRTTNVSGGKSGQKGDIPLLDRVGQVVPESLRWAFADREPARMLRAVKACITAFEMTCRRSELMKVVTTQSDIEELNRWYHAKRFKLPHAVCGYCGGTGKDPEKPDANCPWCHGRGFLGKLQYENLPREYKASAISTSSTNTEDSNKDKE